MFATRLRLTCSTFAASNIRKYMADKIKSSYKFSKSFYDDAITQGKWWSKLYFKLLWGGVDDNEIARRVLSWIPDDFSGKLLDVPVWITVRICWNRLKADSVVQALRISRRCRAMWAHCLLKAARSTRCCA